MSMEASVIINLAGNLAARARAMGGVFDRLGRNGSNAMKLLSSGAAAAGRGLDSMANRYTAFATGATMTLAIRNTMTMEQKLTRMAIAAGKTNKEMEDYKNEIYDLALKTKVAESEIIAAGDKIMTNTGDYSYLKENNELIAQAIAATGASGEEMGAVFSEFQKAGRTAPEIQRIISTMIVQGKAGAMTFAAWASQSERIGAAQASIGQATETGFKRSNALLQVFKDSTQSADVAATAYEAYLATFSKADKVKKLQEAGIKVFETDAKGNKVVRDSVDLFREIVAKSNGNSLLVSEIFDETAMKGIKKSLGIFKEEGKLTYLDNLLSISDDGSTLFKDAAQGVDNFTGSLTQLTTAWNKFADAQLTGPIQTLTRAMNQLGEKNLSMGFTIAGYTAAALAGAVALRKLYTGGMAVRGWMQAMTGAGGNGGAAGMGGMGGAMMGKTPLPVYVVNFGGAGGMGLNMPGPGGKGTGGASGKMPKGQKPRFSGGRVAGAGMAALGVGLAGMNMVSTVTDDTKTYNEKVDDIGSTAGSLAGGLAGMAAGAAIGSIVPVVGTAVGAVAGGVLGMAGSYFGANIGSWVSDFFKEDEKPIETPATDPFKDSCLAIKVEAFGDIRASIDQVKGPLDLDVKSGLSHSAMIGR